jgi:hypothetical protein
MSSAFERATAIRVGSEGPGSFHGVVPEGWRQGKGAFGGGVGVASADNYFVEMRELWSGERVVAMNQQTFALLS